MHTWLLSVSSNHTCNTGYFIKATSQPHTNTCKHKGMLQGPLAPEGIMRWKSWNSASIVVWVWTAWWLVHSDAPVTRKSVGPSPTRCKTELAGQRKPNRGDWLEPDKENSPTFQRRIYLLISACEWAHENKQKVQIAAPSKTQSPTTHGLLCWILNLSERSEQVRHYPMCLEGRIVAALCSLFACCWLHTSSPL